MSELKTLKDIFGCSTEDNLKTEFCDYEDCIECNTKRDLKKEAIKWIKSRIEFCDRCVWDSKSGETKMKFLYCREHKFWIDRFNIKEEDLKNV